ncbi:hypothetical protein [Streptomyces sp. NPDC059371]|uniref:hypothetical protein n=1 Tax=Streptomyces sp. NPDC059371 TaxID=3346812 RepID=UPI0036C818F8
MGDLGISLEESPKTGAHRDDQTSGVRPDRAIHHELPAWHNWARGIGMLVWFVFFLVFAMTGNASPWTFAVAAGGLFVVPGSDMVVRLLQRTRDRQDSSLTGATVVTPSPMEGSGATRRFHDTAAVRILPKDIVLTDTLGGERWIARGGASGVTSLVRLTDPKSGAVLGVEFRDGTDAVRVLLVWRWWFAGPRGRETWAELVSTLGVPVSDENVRTVKDPDSWWQNHELAADARMMSPIDAKEARSRTRWNAASGRGAEPFIVSLFALLLLPQLVSDQWPARVAGALAILTIVIELSQVVAHQLTSRLQFDRPVTPESP